MQGPALQIDNPDHLPSSTVSVPFLGCRMSRLDVDHLPDPLGSIIRLLRLMSTPSTIEARLIYLHPHKEGSAHHLYANHQEITRTHYTRQCSDHLALRPYRAIEQLFYRQSGITIPANASWSVTRLCPTLRTSCAAFTYSYTFQETGPLGSATTCLRSVGFVLLDIQQVAITGERTQVDVTFRIDTMRWYG